MSTMTMTIPFNKGSTKEIVVDSIGAIADKSSDKSSFAITT